MHIQLVGDLPEQRNLLFRTNGVRLLLFRHRVIRTLFRNRQPPVTSGHLVYLSLPCAKLCFHYWWLLTPSTQHVHFKAINAFVLAAFP